MIFLPFTFYVKSNLKILEVQKLPFLKHLEALNFDFNEFLHFLKAEVYPNQKLSGPKIYKKCISGNSTGSKIEFT